MLREWRLHQFKSVGQRERLSFGPLTLFTGPNSSGKSSVIQSILLIAQTLTSKVADRPLVLNGELAKLGTFDDVLHDGSPDREIGIGFSLSLGPEFLRRSTIRGPSPFFFSTEALEVNARFEFSADLEFAPLGGRDQQKAESLQAQLNSARFHSHLVGRDGRPVGPMREFGPLSFVVRRRSDDEVAELWSTTTTGKASTVAAISPVVLRYAAEGNFDPRDTSAWYPRRVRLGDPTIVAADLEHFLPVRLVQTYHSLPREVYAKLESLLERGPTAVADRLRSWNSSNDLLEQCIAKTILSQHSAKEPESPQGVIGRLLRERLRAGADSFQQNVINQVVQELLRDAPKQLAVELAPLPPQQNTLRQAVSDYFGTSLRYLGPLRDDPKPVYAVPTSSDPSNVGVKGEFTASVLDLYSTKLVDFVPPDALHSIPRRARLADAVRAWVKYLEIADSFSTQDEGKLGHRLYIQPGGIRRNVDLTNVGVGVSQVLPIVVTALVSEPGAALLFEQPELHLHPKVQSRLADFFLAVIQTGRQCVVETHSEYLVNRFRLRIAEAPIGSDLNERIRLYFVERKAHVSHFRDVRINEYGAVPQWPYGFFDQGPEESDRIMDAAMRKRASLK